jgi:hypothetical protein
MLNLFNESVMSAPPWAPTGRIINPRPGAHSAYREARARQTQLCPEMQQLQQQQAIGPPDCGQNPIAAASLFPCSIFPPLSLELFHSPQGLLQPHLVYQRLQPHLVYQGLQPHLVYQGLQPHLVYQGP